MEDDLENKIIDLKASLKFFESVKKEEKEERYDELLGELSRAIDLVINMKKRCNKKGSDLPDKSEVETIGAMLDLINKVDFTTLDKLNQLGGRTNLRQEK